MTAEGWRTTVWKFDLLPHFTSFIPGLGAEYFCYVVIYIDLACFRSGRFLAEETIVSTFKNNIFCNKLRVKKIWG